MKNLTNATCEKKDLVAMACELDNEIDEIMSSVTEGLLKSDYASYMSDDDISMLIKSKRIMKAYVAYMISLSSSIFGINSKLESIERKLDRIDTLKSNISELDHKLDTMMIRAEYNRDTETDFRELRESHKGMINERLKEVNKMLDEI